MKLQAIHPSKTEHKAGTRKKVGKWSFVDDIDTDGNTRRLVRHHDTIMGEFVDTPQWGWTFQPWSIGWGSASDQQGMNKITNGEWTYLRNGGYVRMVAYDGTTVFDGTDVFS